MCLRETHALLAVTRLLSHFASKSLSETTAGQTSLLSDLNDMLHEKENVKLNSRLSKRRTYRGSDVSDDDLGTRVSLGVELLAALTGLALATLDSSVLCSNGQCRADISTGGH